MSAVAFDEAGALLGLFPHRGPECYAVVLADARLPLVGAVTAVAHAIVDHGGEDLARLVPLCFCMLIFASFVFIRFFIFCVSVILFVGLDLLPCYCGDMFSVS